MKNKLDDIKVHFNSHAHVERDLMGIHRNFAPIYFNSHAHVERDVCEMRCMGKESNFNSHAHVERDRVYIYMYSPLNISTHTLTWSVTAKPPFISIALSISTHTLTWSVTFQSAIVKLNDLVISTHTLTWSVTLDVVYIWCLLNVMRTYFFI